MLTDPKSLKDQLFDLIREQNKIYLAQLPDYHPDTNNSLNDLRKAELKWTDYDMQEFGMLVAENFESSHMKSTEQLLREYEAKLIKPKTSPL